MKKEFFLIWCGFSEQAVGKLEFHMKLPSICKLAMTLFQFLLSFFKDMCPFCGPVLDFGDVCSGFQSQGISRLHEYEI